MTYKLSAILAKPSRLWILDDGGGTWTDYSGYQQDGGMDVGTSGHAASLVAGASEAAVFDNTNRAWFTCPTFRQGGEDKTFTLEAWVYPISTDGTYAEQKVLSHETAYDGITINGNVVSFGTEYVSTGSAKASYTLQQTRKVHVVGIHTPQKNTLVVNGEVVEEVDISEEQQADSYVANDTQLYTGQTAGTCKVAANGFAVYTGALTSEQIKANYQAGNKVTIDTTVTNMYSGVPMNFNVADADIFNRVTWSGDLLNGGEFINTFNDAGKVSPILFNSISQPGSWTGTLSLDSGTIDVYGVSLDWQGKGVTVEVSIDGTAWETVAKRTLTTTVPDGFDPTDTELFVRASFPGGITEDDSYISDIVVLGYNNGNVAGYTTHPVTLATPAVLRGDVTVFDYRDDVGVYLDGGSITIAADTAPDPVQPRVLELWVRRHSGALTVNQTGTTYVNGAAGSTIDLGEWTLYHIVTAAPITGDIVISGDVSIAHVGLYEATKSASDIADIYDAFVGIKIVNVAESNTLTIQGTPDPVSIYAHDWQITGAG